MKKILVALALALGLLSLSACTDDDADVVSENLSKAADNFEVPRRVVMFNGITDAYLLEVRGLCNITDEGNQLEVVCKTDGGYRKHFLGLSDNVSYFVEQVSDVKVSDDFYRVTFKPSTVIPDVDLR